MKNENFLIRHEQKSSMNLPLLLPSSLVVFIFIFLAAVIANHFIFIILVCEWREKGVMNQK